jgi:hypothetical protein
MKKKDKLRSLIREEVKKELNEGPAGAAIGYIVGVLVDLFMKRKPKSKTPEKSADELERDFKAKLDRRYETDAKFKKLVDDIAAGKIVI